MKPAEPRPTAPGPTRRRRAPAVGDSAAEFLPQRRTLETLRRAARGCRGCPLFLNATQTVFGAGPSAARVVMIGEQPGDEEDRAGQPFVDFRVSQQHGRPQPTPWAQHLVATLHPSSVLRQPTPEQRAEARAQLIADLRAAAALI